MSGAAVAAAVGPAVLSGKAEQSLAAAASQHTNELIYKSATTLASMVREKKISSVELVQAHIDHIKRIEPQIHAVLYLAEKQALTRAHKADAALARGENWGPLHGVPVSIKDVIETAEIPTTAGAQSLKNNIPKRDATVVERLREAGAIVLAKTNLPFFCCSSESTNVFQQTNNPYDLSRTPGGSSGGEGALIAAGGSPLGLGTDTGGSVRVPANWCGLAGLYPSYGRVSIAGLLMTQGEENSENTGGPWYCSVGPMARYVEDLALALPIISGPDYRDAFAFPLPLHDWRNVRMADLRVAVWTGDKDIDASPEVSAVIHNAAKALEKRGAKVKKTNPPFSLRLANDINWAITAGFLTESYSVLKTYRSESDPTMPIGIEMARKWVKDTGPERIKALQAELPKFRKQILASYRDIDAVLCPVTRTPAVLHGETWRTTTEVENFTYGSMLGLVWSTPSGTVRCGTSPEGLPIGAMITASPGREDMVLGILNNLEQEFGGWQLSPLKLTQ